MGLESPTYVADLINTNPTLSDVVSQGDDHLRNIKLALQNTFPGANRAFPISTSITKAANYSVLATDQNKIIYVAPSPSAVQLTMPTLTAADYGWTCTVIKAVGVGESLSLHIAPPSGNLLSGNLSVARARRCLPGIPFRVMWTEGLWLVERCVHAPIGSVMPFWGAALPPGYEWPNSQTLGAAATAYPEYNSIIGSGVTPDLRQRAVFGTDLAGSASARITAAESGVDGTALGAAGGVQSLVLAVSDLPAHHHNITSIAVGGATATHTHDMSSGSATTNGAHTHTTVAVPGQAAGGGAGGLTQDAIAATAITSSNDGAHTHPISGSTGANAGDHSHNLTGTVDDEGGGGTHNNLPPALIMNYILVVE